MPSPFPGMDPYIEQPRLWPDFHSDLAGEVRARLNRTIRPRYIALLASTVTYETVEIGQLRSIRPDVGVWSSSPATGSPRGGVASIAPAPAESEVPMEVSLTLHHVEIRAVGSDQLVTVIEMLSPVNKRPGHDAYVEYLRKRRDLLKTEVHVLEIDLLRGGGASHSGAPG